MRRPLLLVVPAALAAVLLPTAAQADTSTVGDPARDAVSSLDLLTARFSLTDARVKMVVTTRTLSSGGLFRLKVSPVSDVDARVDVTRRSDGSVRVRCSGYDYTRRVSFVQDCSGATGSWDRASRTVTVSVPRDALLDLGEGYDPYVVQAFSYRDGAIADSTATRTLRR